MARPRGERVAPADPGGGGPLTARLGWLLVALLGAAPLVGLGWGAWAAGGGADGGWSLAVLAARLARPAPWHSLLWSAGTALAATALATAAALAVALAFRGTCLAHRAARSLAALPLAVPPVVVAAAGVLVLAQSGLVARLLAAVGVLDAPAGMPALLHAPHGIGLVLALAWKELGFLALLACTVAATLDPELEAAARTHGGTRAQVARRVVLPLLWRGIAPGVVAVFAFALGSYELPALLGPSRPQPLAVAVLERARDTDPAARGDAWAAALLLFAAAGVAVWLHARREAAR